MMGQSIERSLNLGEVSSLDADWGLQYNLAQGALVGMEIRSGSSEKMKIVLANLFTIGKSGYKA